MADNTQQRRNVATAAVKACVALTEALYALRQQRDQKNEFLEPFVDSDFVDAPPNVGLAQCNAAMIGTLFDFVLPSLDDWFEDVGNGGRNQQIVLQMRPG